MSNVIKAVSYLNVDEEKLAAEVITPGYLIELNSNDKFQKHGTAAGTVFPAFADINWGIGGTITDDYSSGDRVLAWYPTTGDIVENAMLDGASPDIAIGDPIESNGDGKLRKHDVTSSGGELVRDNMVIGFAKEQVQPGGDDTRFKLQIA